MHSLRYAFVHIPKTAGSSVRHLLRCAYGAAHCDIKVPVARRHTQRWVTVRDIRRARFAYPQLAGICGHRVTCFSGIEQVLPERCFFTFLRDPVERFLSHFQHFHCRMDRPFQREDLLKYAADPGNRNLQSRWLCGRQDVAAAVEAIERHMGLVGLTSHFDESLILLMRWLGLPESAVSPIMLNPARKKAILPYREDPRLRDAVREANAVDLAVYDHVVTNVFPRQWMQAGEEAVSQRSAVRERSHHAQADGEALWPRFKRNVIYKPLLHLP